MTRPWTLLLPLAAMTAACTGLIGDGPDKKDGPKEPSTPTNFVCDENLVPAQLPLRRLSLVQYRNTVEDLVRYLLPSDADTVIAAVTGAFDGLPEDLRIGPDQHYAGFTSLDQAVQQEHVDGVYGVAAMVAAELTSTDARLAEVAGACATDTDTSNDAICIDELIRRFGERALRRAISDDDVAFYRQPATGTTREDYADVLALIMNAPHMVYFVEHGDGGEGDRTPLGGYELAARLSYHFWQTLPDEELLEAARNGDLQTDEGFAAQVERIFAHPRTAQALASFFDQWLENSTLEELDSRVGTPVFDAFAGSFAAGPDLRENMLAEVTDAALYYVSHDGSYGDFLASDRSFARTDDLASIYGVPAWDGQSEPPAFGPERAGLITRAAYLATGSANTRPIMKGVFLRKAVLCDEIPPPPPNAAANPPQLSDELSTREVVEELTHNGVCAGCHQTVINPLGFATENFDALGRVRSEQQLFDETTGAVVGSAEIDTESVPGIDSGDDTVSSGAADLSRLIQESPKPYACFARQYFRFTFGRVEDIDLDACALDDVKQTLDEGKPLAEVLRTVALTRSFRERSFVDVEVEP